MSSGSVSRSRALVQLARPDAARWAVLVVLAAVGSALALAGPLVVRRIVDDATDGTTTAALTRLALLYLALAIAAQIVRLVVAWHATFTAWGTTNGIRIRLTRHVLDLDHEFHRRNTPGALIQRVDGDVTAVSDLLGKVVPTVVGAGFLTAGMIAVLTALDWRLGVAMSFYVAASAAVVARNRHGTDDEASQEMASLATVFGGIEERLTAAEDLRANGASGHAMWRFVHESSAALRSGVHRERAFLRIYWRTQGAIAGGSVLALLVGAALVGSGAMSLGSALLMLQYVLLLSRPLESVVDQLELVQKANGAMVRVIDLLDVAPTIIDAGNSIPPPGALGVELDDVSFDYGDGHPVLTHVTLNVAAGRSIGIVGRTGSGKTTLSRLVLRLIEASVGQVRLGGIAIENIPMNELRRRVALIPQEVELLAGSVRDNVTMFDALPTDEAVRQALYSVGLDALIDGGIHRQLGSNGAGLSGGEAQLLALARVWLRQPDLIVLDEATARVDPQTEARIDAAVDALKVGRTTIVIAHRLSTLDRVDEIAVFDSGRLVEHGDRNVLATRPDSAFHRLLTVSGEDTVSGGDTVSGEDTVAGDTVDLVP